MHFSIFPKIPFSKLNSQPMYQLTIMSQMCLFEPRLSGYWSLPFQSIFSHPKKKKGEGGGGRRGGGGGGGRGEEEEEGEGGGGEVFISYVS